MASFTERMIGAAKLDVHAYEEVETDTGATSQAMGVVLLASLAGGIGLRWPGNWRSWLGLFRHRLGVDRVGLLGLCDLHHWHPAVARAPNTRRRRRAYADPGVRPITGSTSHFRKPPGVGPLVLLLIQIWLFVTMVVAIRQALDYHSPFRAVGVCLVGLVAMVFSSVVVFLLFGGP